MPPDQLIKPTVPVAPTPTSEQKQSVVTKKPVALPLVPVATQSTQPQATIITPKGAVAAPIVPLPMTNIVDPAKTLGTVGLVLAVLLPPVGAGISGYSYYKSNKLGFANYRALAGIIVGAFMSIMALMFLSVI